MKKPNFLSVGDVHIADKAPGARIDNYRQAVIDKLLFIRDEAERRNSSAVIFTGDIFHLKRADRNSHSLVRELIEVLQSFPCPRLCAPGNHDMKNDRLDSLPHQPLGVVFRAGGMVELTPEGCLFSILPDGTMVEGYVPDGKVVKVAATSYNEQDPLPECHAVTKAHPDLPEGEESDFLVTVGHFYSTPEGKDFFGHTCVSYKELYETPADIYVLGHFHMDQGIEEIDGKYFVNIGSLTRGSLDEDNITRQVKLGYLEFSENGIEEVSSLLVPVAPADEIFDLEKYEEIKEERKVMNDFVEKMDVEFSSVSVDDENFGPLQILEEMTLEKDLREEILRRIREAE